MQPVAVKSIRPSGNAIPLGGVTFGAPKPADSSLQSGPPPLKVRVAVRLSAAVEPANAVTEALVGSRDSAASASEICPNITARPANAASQPCRRADARQVRIG